MSFVGRDIASKRIKTDEYDRIIFFPHGNINAPFWFPNVYELELLLKDVGFKLVEIKDGENK